MDPLKLTVELYSGGLIQVKPGWDDSGNLYASNLDEDQPDPTTDPVALVVGHALFESEVVKAVQRALRDPDAEHRATALRKLKDGHLLQSFSHDERRVLTCLLSSHES